MQIITSFPTALFASCLLHLGMIYAVAQVYVQFQSPVSVPVYFVDYVLEEPPEALPSPAVPSSNIAPSVKAPTGRAAAPHERANVPSLQGNRETSPPSRNPQEEENKSNVSTNTHSQELNPNTTAPSKDFTDFQYAVLKRLESFKKYPASARRRSEEGRGILRLELDRQGALHSATLDSSTGSTLLDEELLALANRASPFPAIPTSVPGEIIYLKIPVSFKLH